MGLTLAPFEVFVLIDNDNFNNFSIITFNVYKFFNDFFDGYIWLNILNDFSLGILQSQNDAIFAIVWDRNSNIRVACWIICQFGIL